MPRRRKIRPHSLTLIIDQNFMQRVAITERGAKRSVTTFEAIYLKIFSKEIAGDDRAARVRLKYDKFAARGAKPKQQLIFLDNLPSQAATAQVRNDGVDER